VNTIEIIAITKDYRLGVTTVHALRGINLEVTAGNFLALVGPSGSGKTTLLNIIGCIDTPSSGEVKIDGQKLNELPEKAITALRLHKLGFIFQSFNLIPVLNVRENIEFPLLLLKGLTKAERNARVTRMIHQVGLADYDAHKPAELSGGQRQRVAIARALVTRPQIVLADEPTANLDSETSQVILGLMRELNERENTTFIFSTHDPEILNYAKQVVKIKDGCISL
jgi:putative ABC transport system ATP-binding protein